MTHRNVSLLVTIAAAVWLCGIASPAGAQVQLQALGGVTNSAASAPFYAGALGIRVTFLEVDFEGGHFNNVLPKGLVDTITQLEQQHGLPVQAIASVPANYVLGNLRLISPGGLIRPFVSGGVGIAWLEPRLDITVDDISLGDIFGVASLGTQKKTMALVSAGLRLDLDAINIEGGYRLYVIYTGFRRNPNLTGDQVLGLVNTAYAGLAIKF